jgi:DNA-binding CsgD family transcriptional regulator/PAS domain-containing protein
MAGAFGDFGSLTDAFMAAAVDPLRWDAAMGAAAKATGSFGAIMVPVKGKLPHFPMSDGMQPSADAYVRDGWISRDVRYKPLPTLFRRRVASEFDFTTPDEMARSAYYQEFLAPYGLRWFSGVKVGEGDDVWVLSLQRSIAQGPFSPVELDRLAALSRRLASVAELARAFNFARIEAALEAFEASHSPVAMVDRMGEVVRLNRSAERLMGPDLEIVRRRIVSFNSDATAALDRALHDLIWRQGAEACQAPVPLPRRSGRRPIVAYASRLSNPVREGFALAQGFVVFVDLDARPAPIAADLMRVFGLTFAEARLADRLLREDSLEAAAETLSVSYATARNQLRAAYQKTETHSQGQLIALISRLARGQIPGA